MSSINIIQFDKEPETEVEFLGIFNSLEHLKDGEFPRRPAETNPNKLKQIKNSYLHYREKAKEKFNLYSYTNLMPEDWLTGIVPAGTIVPREFQELFYSLFPGADSDVLPVPPDGKIYFGVWLEKMKRFQNFLLYPRNSSSGKTHEELFTEFLTSTNEE